jgi:inner membrane protein
VNVPCDEPENAKSVRNCRGISAGQELHSIAMRERTTMFIGHLPAGYMLTRAMWSKLDGPGLPTPNWKSFLLAGLVASMFPDIDLAYFYLIDNRQHLHHSYWTHLPFYWLVIGVLVLSFVSVSRKKWLLPYLAVVEANVFLHCFLDTIVGKIRWLYPFSREDLYLFSVPQMHSWYVLDFILHWSFLLEILTVITSIYVYMQWPVSIERSGYVGIERDSRVPWVAPLEE